MINNYYIKQDLKSYLYVKILSYSVIIYYS